MEEKRQKLKNYRRREKKDRSPWGRFVSLTEALYMQDGRANSALLEWSERDWHRRQGGKKGTRSLKGGPFLSMRETHKKKECVGITHQPGEGGRG